MTTSEKKREYNKRHREKQAQKKESIENLKIEKKHIIPKFEFSEISENSENFEISKKNIKLPKPKISENPENSENSENPKNDFFPKATPKVTPRVSKTIEFSPEISKDMPEENFENLNENFSENSDDYVLDKKTYLTLLELAKKGREAPKTENSKVQVENIEKIQKVENEQSFFFQFKKNMITTLAGLAPMLAIQGFMMVGTQLYPKLTKPSPLSNTLNRQEEPATNSQNGYTVRTSNWA